MLTAETDVNVQVFVQFVHSSEGDEKVRHEYSAAVVFKPWDNSGAGRITICS